MLVLCPELVSPDMLVAAVQTTELLPLLALMTLVTWNLALPPLTTLDEMWLPLAVRAARLFRAARASRAFRVDDLVALADLLELDPVDVEEDVEVDVLVVWQLTAIWSLIPMLSVLVMLWLITMPFELG